MIQQPLTEVQARSLEKAKAIYWLLMSQTPDTFEKQVEKVEDDMAGVSEIILLESWLNSNEWNFFLNPQLIPHFLNNPELDQWKEFQNGDFELKTQNTFLRQYFWLANSLNSLGFDIPFDGYTHHYTLFGKPVYYYEECQETLFGLTLLNESEVSCGTIGNPISFRPCSWKRGMTITNHDGGECSYRVIRKATLLTLVG